jgi:hypothetical protein
LLFKSYKLFCQLPSFKIPIVAPAVVTTPTRQDHFI